MQHIKFLKDINKKDVLIAGGKGASLGEMMSAGIPVPDGFVILSSAFEYFLSQNDLTQEIEAILHKINHREMKQIEKASENIETMIIDREMPESLLKEIKESFKKLDSKFLAVRSSATAEDSASHTWAGQLDSFLNTTSKNLEENIKRCFSSLFTPRAIFYRFEKGLHNSHISVAVVVQKMVNSEKSGIAFSVHPVTEDRNQMIVEASWGLGEAIVSGQITPDSYIVTKEPRKILDINIAEKTQGLFRQSSGGNIWKDTSDRNVNKQCLSEKEIMEISSLILKIENHYGFPCDIEWAFEKGKFYITQSRPITTLKNIQNPIIKKISKSLEDQIIFGKWDLGHERRLTYQKMRMFNYAYQVPLPKYFKVKVLTEIHRVKDGLSSEYLESNELDEALQKITDVLKDERSLRLINDLILLIKKGYARFEYFNKSTPSSYNNYSDRELIKIYKKFCKEDERLSFPVWLIFTGFEEALIEAIKLFCINKKIEMPDLDILSKPTTINPLDKYTKDFSDIVLSSGTKQASMLKSFYRKYIHWGMYDCTYDELPLSYYKERLRDFSSKFSSNFFLSKKEAYKNIKKEKNKVFRKYKKEKLLLLLIKLFHTIANFKDWKNFHREKNSYKLKILLKEIAKRSDFSLEQVAFMTEEEISNIFLEKTVLASDLDKRKQNSLFIFSIKKLRIFTDQNILKQIDSIIKQNNEFQELKGQTAYKGRVIGEVAIVISDNDFSKIKDGSILVSGTTRPSFTPIMSKVKAIVVNEGGIISHTAILARELKKPCIIGTKIATKVLKDGDLVEVDAEKGIVTIISK